MLLLPRELDGLTTHAVGYLAQKRLARGVKLNYTEACGLIASQLLELIRDGHPLSQLAQAGREMLGTEDVLPGVADMLDDVQVEGTFPDGTKLVTVHRPICRRYGNWELALYGSFIPYPQDRQQQHDLEQRRYGVTESCAVKTGRIPGKEHVAEGADVLTGNDLHKACENESAKAIPGAASVIAYPGEYLVDRVSLLSAQDSDVSLRLTGNRKGTKKQEAMIEINQNRRRILLNVRSHCDRPIQARRKAMKTHHGTGETLEVSLVAIGGHRHVVGGNALVDGDADNHCPAQFLSRLQAGGFLHSPTTEQKEAPPTLISRTLYAKTFGPTVGDRLRLGDSCLLVEVENDFTVYGEECRFGGGKVLREGMGQMASCPSHDALDTVITNAVIIDAVTGIVKADIGLKNNLIVGIGKAGNPDVMDSVDCRLIVGAGTECIAGTPMIHVAEFDELGEGLIVTAGAVDTHVHFICPQVISEALSSGITTLIGGGTGPATGSKATTCTPGAAHLQRMAESTDDLPINIGMTGKGSSASRGGQKPIDLEEQIIGGAIGLKIHEDWGATPAAIESCLSVAQEYDIQVTIHTDTLNESCCVEQTIAAFKGRCIHTYHSEGAGGGHAPDILRVVGEPYVLPSSTNPTRPYTIHTLEEHVDMLFVCHHLDKNLKEDLSFAESRIRAETIQAEDILHDLGAISIISSDAQAMGRIGEVISRTWQTAAKMKEQQGSLPEDAHRGHDNFRVKRYIAKYTINPARIAHKVGSVTPGTLADLVLWKPAFFGVKPHLVLKGGQIVWGEIGLANGSIPTPQPVMYRPMFGAMGHGPNRNSLLFVSQACLDNDIPTKAHWKVQKQLEAVRDCRSVTKYDMLYNSLCPVIRVDPESYEVQLYCVTEKRKAALSFSPSEARSVDGQPLTACGMALVRQQTPSALSTEDSSRPLTPIVRPAVPSLSSLDLLPESVATVEPSIRPFMTPVTLESTHQLQDENSSCSTESSLSEHWITLECEASEILPLTQRYLLF